MFGFHVRIIPASESRTQALDLVLQPQGLAARRRDRDFGVGSSFRCLFSGLPHLPLEGLLDLN